MPIEYDEIKVKKGYIVAINDIPVDYTEVLGASLVNFTPKTITNITIVVRLLTGSALTLQIMGFHDFPSEDDVYFEIYSNIFAANGVVEIPGCSFQRYDILPSTDATTTASVYIFFEYDYDLIK